MSSVGVRFGNKNPFARALRKAGFKATLGRVALLEELKSAGKPVSVEYLAQKLKGKLDVVNAYRALEVLAGAGVVRRVDLGHVHGHYELEEGDHHHHVICDSCGEVEDVDIKEPGLERAALAAARHFKSVRTHALEFFGTCRACA